MIGGKTAATVAFATMLAVTAAAHLPGRGDAARDKVVCTDFATFDEAQQALLANKQNAVTLDPDGNGIACEEVFPAESAAAATATAAASPAPAGNAAKKAARQATATAAAAAAETPTPQTASAGQNANAAKKAARQATATAEKTATAEAAAGSGGNAAKKAARQATATAEAEAAGRSKKPKNAAPTPVGGDLDCIDFAFQEDAQAVLDQNPKDPYNLDPNHDGIACSSLPRRGGPIVALPATGSGPTPPNGWPVHAGL